MRTTYEQERHTLRSPIQAVKEAVAIEDVAAEYTELRSTGDAHYVGRCPIPGHEDKTPSFHVYAGCENPHWWCFGCSTGGDVLDLEEICGRHAEVTTAMVALSVRYGVELPGRSERWHEAQTRKVDYLDAAYAVIGQVLCRRLYKVLVLPYIEAITDLEDRERELERSWRDWQRSRRWAAAAEALLSGNEDLILALARIYAETRPELAETLTS